MKKTSAFLIFVGCWLLAASGAALAVDFPMSKYGQIQNVQSYSSNPFYNPNSPYNQRMPVPIYAQGTELNAGACRAVADALVAQQCASRNGCAGMKFSDVRPGIIIQMANLSGHNYISACEGYVQPAFESYLRNSSAQMEHASFPAGAPAAASSGAVVISNPFKTEAPQWATEMGARQNELRELQRQNGSDDVQLSAQQFPETYGDLSFVQRMENARKGYAPWKDAKAFNYIKLETDAERLEREKSEAEAKAAVMGAEKKLEDVLKTTDLKAWCLRHPIECEGDHDLYKNDICKNNADRIAKGDTITYKDKFEDNKERKLTKDDCMKLSASAEILAAKQKQEAARKAAAEAAIAAALEKLKTENPAEWCGKVGAAECNAAAEESKIAACKKCESENYEVYLAGKCEWTNPYVADASHVTLGLEYCRRHVEGLTSKDIYEQNKKEDEEKKAKEETETTVEDLKYKYTTTISLNFGTDDECDYQLLNWLENNIEKEKKCIFDQSIIKCDIMGDYQYTDKKGKSKDEPLITIGGETAVFERVTANEMFDANKDKKDSACDGKIFNDQEIGFCDIYGKNCRELTIDG